MTDTATDHDLVMGLLDLADVHGSLRVLAQARALWPDDHPLPSHPARHDDPQTSQDAAVRHASTDVGRFTARSVKAAVLNEIARSVDGLTALDAARRATGSNDPLRTETARKRVAELAYAGLIVATGRTERAAGSPDESIVWYVTVKGAHAVNLLKRNGWSK